MPIDYAKYPPDWKTRIRPAVLERAQNKCEFCGVAYDNPRHIANRKLTQHGRYAKGHGYFGVGKLF